MKGIGMFDLSKLSDDDKKLLQEIAKAKGKTLEDVAVELGHGVAAKVDTSEQVDQPVTFSGKSLTQASGEPSSAVTPEQSKPSEPELPPQAPEEPQSEAENQPIATDEAGLATMRSVCSHCGWDQAVPPVPPPEHQDKLIFLQAILGQKVFNKRYSLFGGNLRVTFRSLTVREIDALYVETFKAQKAGVIETTTDYYEYLNRQRVFLQLIGLSASTTALHITLPDGYTRETHPDAESYWDDFLEKENLYVRQDDKASNSLMLKVQDYILTHVLKTEHLQRTINHACGLFNRLVTKLEASVDNENFWNAIEPPT